MFSFRAERKYYSAKIQSDDSLLLPWMSINHISSGYFRFIKTAQSVTLKPPFGPKVCYCSNIRRQTSGFYGKRPRNSPIWHSHREGTKDSYTDVTAIDLTGHTGVWAGPPRPCIACCDWLIKISNFPILCLLYLAQETMSCLVKYVNVLFGLYKCLLLVTRTKSAFGISSQQTLYKILL